MAVKESYWQKVRGICIIVVVAIHVLAEYQLRCTDIRLGLVLFRQLLNFAVPTFIFMAGYFTNASKVNDSIGKYYLKRVERLFIPYLLWSTLYYLLRGHGQSDFLNVLITGNASWQLYYIVVLLQCAIITPLLVKINGGGVKYTIILFFPYMLFRYYCAFSDISISFPLCVEYLPFYAYGLNVGKTKKIDSIYTKNIKSITLLLLVFSFVEAFGWYKCGNLTMAMTQGKLTSYAFAMGMIICFILFDKATEGEANVLSRWLKKMGDYSYGIFYVHMFVIFALEKLWDMLPVKVQYGGVYCLLNFFVVMIVSYGVISCANIILPKKISIIVGLK